MSMRQIKRKKENNFDHKKLLLIAVIIGLLLTVGYFIFQKTYSSDNTFSAQDNSQEESKINLDPPTKEEQKAGDEQKETNIKRQESVSLPDTAEVAIVDAAQYNNEIEIRAFVSNIIEDGECTMTFSKDDVIFSKSVPAYADATTTPCINLTVPRSEFSKPGSWDVTVTYSNGKLTGKSKTGLVIQ